MRCINIDVTYLLTYSRAEKSSIQTFGDDSEQLVDVFE